MLTPPVLLYILTTLCLTGTLPCVDFMDVIMGDMLLFPHGNTACTTIYPNHTVFDWDTSMC